LFVKSFILVLVFSSILTIFGTAWNSLFLKSTGLVLTTINITLIIVFGDKLKTQLLVFTIVLCSLTLSTSYEMLSNYPLGDDVHAEYFIVKKMYEGAQLVNIQEEASKLFEIPEYYFEIINFLFSTNIASKILGLDPLFTIKLIWNSLILGLIPLIIFIFAYSIVKDKKASLISAMLIVIQSTYLTTLHSTSKHTTALFLVSIMFLTIIRIITKSRNYGGFLTLSVLAVGLTGYHYFTSGVFAMVLTLGLLLQYLIALISKNRYTKLGNMENASYLVIVFVTIWITWYFIMFQGLTYDVVNLLIRLFTLEKPGYYYEYINVSMPAILNLARLAVNGIIALNLIASGLVAFLRLLRGGNYIDSIILVASVLFFVGASSELLGISTIGIGRVSLTLMVFIAPYFYYTFATLIHKFYRFSHKDVLIALLIALIFATRALISFGILPYAFSDLENSIFLDQNYKFKTSLSYADVQATSFITKFAQKVVEIGIDLRSQRCFIYRSINGTNVSLNTNYFKFLENEQNPHHFTQAIYISSYNVIENKVELDVITFEPVDRYLTYLTFNSSLIYNGGYVYVYKL